MVTHGKSPRGIVSHRKVCTFLHRKCTQSALLNLWHIGDLGAQRGEGTSSRWMDTNCIAAAIITILSADPQSTVPRPHTPAPRCKSSKKWAIGRKIGVEFDKGPHKTFLLCILTPNCLMIVRLSSDTFIHFDQTVTRGANLTDSREMVGKGSNQSAHNLMMDAPVITGNATAALPPKGGQAEPTHLMPSPLSHLTAEVMKSIWK